MIAKEPKEIQIGAFRYRVIPLGARKSLHVFTRLCNVAAPLVESLKPQGGAFTPESGLAALGKFLRDLKPDDLEWLADEFAARTEVSPDGHKWITLQRKDSFDLHFEQASLKDLFDWLKFCLEVNYSDFLGGWVTSLGVRFSGKGNG